MQTITRVVFGVIAFAVAMSASLTATACSCDFSSPEENLKSATAVFWGKAEKVTVENGRRVATFDVGKWFKGSKQKSVKVSTNVAGTACGVHFRAGDSYLVFAYDRSGNYSTSSCSNTQQMRVKPTSATKPPPERSLTRQKKALDPVLRPLAEEAAAQCGAGAQFKLTFYDNGEFDIDRESECWDKHFAPKFKVPKLPSGYPFTVFVWLRKPEISLRYEDDRSTPLVRGRMAEQLTWRLPVVRPDEQLLRFQLEAMGQGRRFGSLASMVCLLSGEAAARRYLKKRLKSDPDGARYLDETRVFYECAVQRQDWARAAELVGDLPDHVAGATVRNVRAETKSLKGAPSLDALSVSGTDILRVARSSNQWADDVVLLQLVAQALLAQPKLNERDKELAAMAYARAAFLHAPADPELAKKAIELGGESVVDDMERLSNDPGIERAKERLQKLKDEGKTVPKLPK